MLSTILLSFVAFWIALLPVYLWGYGVSYLLDTPWNRRRFILGMTIWGLSVGIVWLFSYINHLHAIYTIVASVGFVLILTIVVSSLIQRGSIFARGVLQKVTRVNSIVVVLLLLFVVVSSNYIPGSTILIVSVIPLLISSLIEESSKHLMSIGLMSQDYRFSRSDIIIFTIFVVLGFIFIENLLYLFQANISLPTWIFRSFFSLSAHLLSAVICAYAWWRALSYEPYSTQYVSIFSLGFIIAVIAHLGYNMILAQGSTIGLFVYMVLWYVVVTQGIIENIKSNNK